MPSALSGIRAPREIRLETCERAARSEVASDIPQRRMIREREQGYAERIE
jgi:hypothetical protein